ncbi:hypothetical protein NQ314_005658 [Rhamnusium bicolor]|uniref:Negative elongation factor D n=1 Tax=Rhamnusium bicolor TaxID=1586634 RepID=A0AAV8ZGU7_9CUCU|nr:hypothetical protein NQ314_005658 [Rhamnusium bicolor]
MDDDYDDRPWDGGDRLDNESGGEESENPEQVLAECAEKFSTPDYIMEPGIFSQLKRYFQSGGNPLQVIEELSQNYTAVAQMANLIAEWLIIGGIGETPAWLTQLIEHPTWRSLIYRLAEEYPDCLMLNFTIKLISDAGFQGEITSISTAAQQLEVFSRVLKTSISSFLTNPEEWQNTSKECASSYYTYIGTGNDVTPITMALNGASAYPTACQALTAMLSKNTLNPADITVLYRNYNAPDPPPIDLIRTPQFLELLVDSLFKPGVKLNPDYKPKYIHLLAYAASVSEVQPKKGQKRVSNKEELQPTIRAIETVHNICNGNKGSSELIAELSTIYQSLKFPVVSVGIIRWVECTVTEPSYFKLCTEHTPIHLALLDEVVTLHPLLHNQVLDLLIRLFESKQDELEILVQLEMRKMVLDRMVNLLCSGCVVPVVKYIKQCWQRGDTDISLIRYFVTEVLETIGPPYSSEFVHLFMPMVENDEITGTMRGDGENDPVSEFIGHGFNPD